MLGVYQACSKHLNDDLSVTQHLNDHSIAHVNQTIACSTVQSPYLGDCMNHIKQHLSPQHELQRLSLHDLTTALLLVTT